MIKVISGGKYQLSETKNRTKILTLNSRKHFAWIDTQKIGELLITLERPHPKDRILSEGNYRMYQVKKEPHLTDLIHLELLVGQSQWQGYLLPTGLPTSVKRKSLIIPTQETITVS